MKDLFQAIAAKTPDGSPCCEWVGEDGAGHYVKMIHNGIEYGDMQIIAEAYHVMRDGLALPHAEMHRIFGRWNAGDLQSYLIEITRDIMAFPDTDGQPLVEKILDSAGQKGTGKWTGINSLDLGIPVTLISEAVYARCLSALKDERLAASLVLSGPRTKYKGNTKALVTDLRNALLSSKLVSYAQGFMLMREAAGNTAGTWTSARSPCCGARAASFVAHSWRKLRMRSPGTPACRISCWTIISTASSGSARAPGAGW